MLLHIFQINQQRLCQLALSTEWLIIMVSLRSKKGHIATAIFSFFFFFFSFSLTLGFSSISRKPLEIKLPYLNMFVSAKNCTNKKNSALPGLRALPGAKMC